VEDMQANLEANCLPVSLLGGNAPSYDDFLQVRRQLMAQKIKTWFAAL
jgi:hypothetical protein